MHSNDIARLHALTRGEQVTYHDLETMTIRITSAGLLADHVEVWRDGQTAPTYQGLVECWRPVNGWRAMAATGKARNKTDALRERASGQDYATALAMLLDHDSARPVKQPWCRLHFRKVAELLHARGIPVLLNGTPSVAHLDIGTFVDLDERRRYQLVAGPGDFTGPLGPYASAELGIARDDDGMTPVLWQASDDATEESMVEAIAAILDADPGLLP